MGDTRMTRIAATLAVLLVTSGLHASQQVGSLVPVIDEYLNAASGDTTPPPPPPGPSGHWVPSRNGDDAVEVLTLGDARVFGYEHSSEEILTGFPVGHNLPKEENHLFYNLYLDGYHGLPFGSCLQRSRLLPNNDPDKAKCAANENRDLLRVWSNRNENLRDVLVKNVIVKNAFRTFNVVDGEDVTTSSGIPHTDTFQSYYGGSARENPDWLVIQDAMIANSDNSLMIVGSTRFQGFVYQNLHTTCDEAFKVDALARKQNDHNTFGSGETVVSHACSNAMGASSDLAAPVWLIGVKPGSDSGRVGISNQGARVVVVGSNHLTLRVTTRDANRKVVDHPNVARYPDLESALAAGENRPPYIELSCTGWRTPPGNCEARRGYLD